MVAVRDAEVAARSIGLNPVIVKTAAFALSAVFTGLAGAIFAPLMMFVAPDSFPFSQSILFLLAVIVGGAGWVLGPVVGAVVSVVLPELLSSLAEYRLLFFGALLLVVLWLAPDGVHRHAGALLRAHRHAHRRRARTSISRRSCGRPMRAHAACRARPRHHLRRHPGRDRRRASTPSPASVTSVIGPNGAGKTTVLNMIGGFYRPDTGSIRLGDSELAGAPAWRVARAGIARTYQTTKLFGTHERARQRADRAAPRPARQSVRGRGDRRAIDAPPRRCSPSSAITARSPRPPATCRTSTAAWSRSPARSPCGRACCCSTSRPPA